MPKKQKSGLYRTKIKIGVDAQGRDINKWVSGRTMAELEDAKREARAYYIDGTALRDDQLFGAYAVAWYRIRKEPRLSDSSRAAYRCMLNKWVLPAFGNRNLRALRQHRKVAQIVVRWLKAMLVVVAVQRDARALRPAAGKHVFRRRAGIEKAQKGLPSPRLDHQRGGIRINVSEQRDPEGYTDPALARHMQGFVLPSVLHAHWHTNHPFQMHQPCA